MRLSDAIRELLSVEAGGTGPRRPIPAKWLGCSLKLSQAGRPVLDYTSTRCRRESYWPNGDDLFQFVRKPFFSEFHPNNLELYVRLHVADRSGEWRSILLPSLQLFWPSVRLVAVLDEESASDQQAARTLPVDVMHEFPPLCVRTAFSADYTPEEKGRHWWGFYRQQLDMLHADQIVSAKYVGFVDTDSLFVAPVESHGVFTGDGRPVIQGSVARGNYEEDLKKDIWQQTTVVAYLVLKKPIVMNCMGYFPVVFATKYIRELREYVERLHKMPFIHAIMKFASMWTLYFFCHFSIMCNYVWHFHRNEYDFHFSNVHDFQPGWDKPKLGQTSNFSFLTDRLTAPFVRMATHFSYVFLEPSILPNKSAGTGKEGRLATVGHLKKRFDGEAAGFTFLTCFCHVAVAHSHSCTTSACTDTQERCEKLVGVTAETLNVFLFRFEMANPTAHMDYHQTRELDNRSIASQKWYYSSLQSAHEWLYIAQSILRTKHCHAYRKLRRKRNFASKMLTEP